MRLNCVALMKNIDGSNTLNQEGKSILCGDLFVEALLHPDPSSDGQTKCRRTDLAMRIFQTKKEFMDSLNSKKEVSGEVEITVEEAMELKEVINLKYPQPQVVYQCWKLIEGK